MKINTNIESISTGRIQDRGANSVLEKTSRTNIEPEKQPQASENLLQKRSIVDAVIVNQIAQGLLQKAVLIASKLRGLASEAISSGKINSRELNDTLKDISSMKNIQDGFNTDVTVRNNTGISQVGVITEPPQIRDDLTALYEFANKIPSGDINLKKIDRIHENLTNKALIADKSYNQLINKLSGPENIAGDNVNYSEYTRNTAGNISKYPQAALKSQGNISYEAVNNLL